MSSLMQPAGEVTALLQKADAGDRSAADALYRLVERDLRAIAGKRKRGFDNVSTESTTVLIDDAFCKLVGGDVTVWQVGDRAKFYSYAATKIHDQLVESARAKLAQKRGGGKQPVDIADLDPTSNKPDEDSGFIIDLHTALAKLDTFAEKEARVFRIYYFLNCTFDEAAELMGVSATEVKRLCKKAQMWLQRELKDYQHDT